MVVVHHTLAAHCKEITQLIMCMCDTRPSLSTLSRICGRRVASNGPEALHESGNDLILELPAKLHPAFLSTARLGVEVAIIEIYQVLVTVFWVEARLLSRVGVHGCKLRVAHKVIICEVEHFECVSTHARTWHHQ